MDSDVRALGDQTGKQDDLPKTSSPDSQGGSQGGSRGSSRGRLLLFS